MRCLFRQAALDHLLMRRLVERSTAREHLIKDAAQTVDVAACVDWIAEQLLRTHVLRRSDHESRTRERFGRSLFDRFCDAEVHDLRDVASALTRSNDDDVGLEIA